MKFENSIQIELNDVYLIGSVKDRYGLNNIKIDKYENKCEVQCDWLMLKNEPNKIFCLYEDLLEDDSRRDELDQRIFKSDIEIINIKNVIRTQLKEIIKTEINEFLDRNINNISHYFECSKQEDTRNLKFNKVPSYIDVNEVGLDLLNSYSYNVNDKVNLYTNKIKYRDIGNGKIHFNFDQYNDKTDITFDLKNMKFEESNLQLLSRLYSKETLKKFLAYEQYKQAITPDYYNEIAKINRYLQGKKTISVLLKDGTEKKIEAETKNILNRDYEGFKLNADRDYNIDCLRAIKYGRYEMPINTNHLQNIEKQLDRLIDLGFENKFEEELEVEND